MIVLWSNGRDYEEHEVVHLDIGSYGLVAAERTLRLVDEAGSVLGTTDTIRWTEGGATELFLSYVLREAPELLAETSASWCNDFKTRLSEVPTEALNVLAERVTGAGRPKDDDDKWAHLVIDEWRWRNRPSRRRRA